MPAVKQDVAVIPEDEQELIFWIDYVVPALEIISAPCDCAQTLEDFLSNNCNYEAAVLGDIPVDPALVNWSLTGMRLEVNGVLRTSGVSAGVEGTALSTMRWLIQTLLREGKFIKAGVHNRNY